MQCWTLNLSTCGASQVWIWSWPATFTGQRSYAGLVAPSEVFLTTLAHSRTLWSMVHHISIFHEYISLSCGYHWSMQSGGSNWVEKNASVFPWVVERSGDSDRHFMTLPLRELRLKKSSLRASTSELRASQEELTRDAEIRVRSDKRFREAQSHKAFH